MESGWIIPRALIARDKMGQPARGKAIPAEVADSFHLQHTNAVQSWTDTSVRPTRTLLQSARAYPQPDKCPSYSASRSN